MKFSVHPVLDWCETEYTEARLIEMVDAIRKHPHSIEARPADGPLSFWNLAIEQVLRALADAPAALKALNHRQKRPPARVVGLNRAVHFHLRAELHPGKKTALYAEVGEIWGVSLGQVKDDVREHALVKDAKALMVERRYDAKRLMLMTVHNVCNARLRAGEHRSSRDDVLEDFDNDMLGRAQQLQSA
jgi:hypothetical protein